MAVAVVFQLIRINPAMQRRYLGTLEQVLQAAAAVPSYRFCSLIASHGGES